MDYDFMRAAASQMQLVPTTVHHHGGYDSLYQAATVKVTDIQLPFNKIRLVCGPLTVD